MDNNKKYFSKDLTEALEQIEEKKAKKLDLFLDIQKLKHEIDFFCLEIKFTKLLFCK